MQIESKNKLTVLENVRGDVEHGVVTLTLTLTLTLTVILILSLTLNLTLKPTLNQGIARAFAESKT
jgi:hypothetical protein